MGKLRFLRVGFDDVLDAYEGAGEHCDEREDHQEKILPQLPLQRAEISVGLKENNFHERRHEEPQSSEEDGAHQTDERLEVGHGNRQPAHHNHDPGSDDYLRNVPRLGDPVLDFLHENLHRDVKLKAEGEEDGEPDEDLPGDGRPLISREVKRDTRLDEIAETDESEESHERVQDGDGDHRDQQHAGLSEELLRFFHRVFHRHDCADSFHRENHRAGKQKLMKVSKFKIFVRFYLKKTGHLVQSATNGLLSSTSGSLKM